MGVDSFTHSPIAAEAARLKRAEVAMRRFCLDLNDLVGRETPEEPTFDTALDPLTAEIYLAAAEAGVKQHEGWRGRAG